MIQKPLVLEDVNSTNPAEFKDDFLPLCPNLQSVLQLSGGLGRIQVPQRLLRTLVLGQVALCGNPRDPRSGIPNAFS